MKNAPFCRICRGPHERIVHRIAKHGVKRRSAKGSRPASGAVGLWKTVNAIIDRLGESKLSDATAPMKDGGFFSVYPKYSSEFARALKARAVKFRTKKVGSGVVFYLGAKQSRGRGRRNPDAPGADGSRVNDPDEPEDEVEAPEEIESREPRGPRGKGSTSTRTEVRSPTSTRTEVRSPTSTRTEVRSPTSTGTSTKAHTSGNVTVTGGAGAGATTRVVISGGEGDRRIHDTEESSPSTDQASHRSNPSGTWRNVSTSKATVFKRNSGAGRLCEIWHPLNRGLWRWGVKIDGRAVAGGDASSKAHAKRWCDSTLDRWGDRRPNPAAWQPKTGQRCSCKPGVWRDNCPACEGTGWVVDFKAIRDRYKLDQEDLDRRAKSRLNPSRRDRYKLVRERHGDRVDWGVIDTKTGRRVVTRESHAVADQACDSYNGRTFGVAGEIQEWARPNPGSRGGSPGTMVDRNGMRLFHCGPCDRDFWRKTRVLEANCPDCGHLCRAERKNPAHPDCPGVGPRHQHYQGKCSTDWNWGVGASSSIAIKTWPKHGAVAMVRPSYEAGLWDWEVKVNGKVVADGNAKSSNHAKKWCVETIGRSFGRSRSNPGLGMPGMPHTWVTAKGVHVSAGDTIVFRIPAGRGSRGQEWKTVQAKVQRMLVFDDHVVARYGSSGSVVDDTNFVRLLRKASRSNPLFGLGGPKRDLQHYLVTDKRSGNRLSVVGGTHRLGPTEKYWKEQGFKTASKRITEEEASKIGLGHRDLTAGHGLQLQRVNPILSVLSNPGRGRHRSRRVRSRRSTPLCKACIRQSTSGGHEPLGSGLRAARARERCGAWDCVRRPHPERR